MVAPNALFALLLAGQAVGAPESGRILVLDIAGVELPAGLTRTLSEIMVAGVREATPTAAVISQDELQSMLMAEERKMLLGCDDTSCLAELGGAIGAAMLVTSSLGRVGTVYVLSIKLIDTQRAVVEKAVTRQIRGGEEMLLGAVSEQAAILFETAPPSSAPAAGAGSAESPPPSAAAPAVPAAPAPAEPAVAALTATSPVEAPPEPAGADPWYGKWWVWTIAGVVVAGAAAGVGLGVALSDSSAMTEGTVTIDFQPPGGS